MDKIKIIEEALDIYEVKEKLQKKQKSGCKVTYERLLKAILDSGNISLKESLQGLATPATISNLTKSLFPDKPRNSTRLDTFILFNMNCKECTNCNTLKPLEEYRPNPSRADGLNNYCKKCQSSTTAETQASRQSNYRAAQLQRTPSWANLASIKKIYSNCPKGKHVDHIIPLQGELVCGLHVENNLQYLTAKENCSKGNR
jgi:hypothetical protein